MTMNDGEKRREAKRRDGRRGTKDKTVCNTHRLEMKDAPHLFLAAKPYMYHM